MLSKYFNGSRNIKRGIKDLESVLREEVKWSYPKPVDLIKLSLEMPIRKDSIIMVDILIRY